MKIYQVPVTWVAKGVMMVEAENQEEAMRKAILVEPLPLGTPVEGSIQVDEESITIK